MGYTQEKLDELLAYQADAVRPDDLEDFWAHELSGQRKLPLHAQLLPYDFPSPYAQVYRISFDGCDTTRIHGWFLKPVFRMVNPDETFPCVVHYHGFTGSCGSPAEYLPYLMLGCCVIAVDCRAQGGRTGDRHTYGTGLVENVCMQGLLSPEDYYFKFLYLDALRALDFVCAQACVDQGRIFTEGGSQGGALSLAAAALDGRPRAVLCDVPSNCEIEKRIQHGYGSFSAVQSYLKQNPDETDRAFETVRYFDLVNLAERIACPVFASAGLLDDVCPAQYFFGAYNRIASEKQVVLYPFNGHEGGASIHFERKLNYLADFLKK